MSKKRTENSQKVCAVIVAFNRRDLLLAGLNALRKQTRPIDAICIIDNSSKDGTPEMLFENHYIEKVPDQNLTEPQEQVCKIAGKVHDKDIQFYYVRMNTNIGASAGIAEGMKRAYDRDYNWIWVMDDDAEPEERALAELLAHSNEENVVALSCLKIYPDASIIYSHNGRFNFNDPKIVEPIESTDLNTPETCIEVDFSSFVGIIIKRDAIDSIGYPKKEFFIHHDDLEYCIRLRKIGKILLVKESRILHKEKMSSVNTLKTIGTKKYHSIPYQSFWVSYYHRRNLLWIVSKYANHKIPIYLRYLKDYLILILFIWLFDDHKMRRSVFITLSYFDGIFGIFNNNKPRIILYGKK